MKKENEKEGTKAELMNAMRPENNAIKRISIQLVELGHGNTQ